MAFPTMLEAGRPKNVAERQRSEAGNRERVSGMRESAILRGGRRREGQASHKVLALPMKSDDSSQRIRVAFKCTFQT